MKTFENYQLQREELLARIAHQLELNPTRRDRMDSAYNAVYDVLKQDPDFFDEVKIELYPQGSVRIGTTVKPINGDDFDLDVVLHIHLLYSHQDPVEIYNAVINALERNEYYKSILEKKTRCARLNYKGDFHMDILPGCIIVMNDLEHIAIPEKKMLAWSSGNPKGFANWFMNIADSAGQSMLLRFSEELLLKAQIEREDLPSREIYKKTPLQRAVQLIKRYRDIYFQNRDYCVSSIVLTTLMAQFYRQQESIYDTIDGVIQSIRADYQRMASIGRKFEIRNPVNSDEIFTDSWTDAHYNAFYRFIEDFHSKWMKLKQEFNQSGEAYIDLFGEGQYQESLREQVKLMGRFDTDDVTKANALILGGMAHTDRRGNITENEGRKNEHHRNFGG